MRGSRFLSSVILTLTTVVSTSAFARPKVTDELVHGLKCAALSTNSIYAAIDPSAFEQDRRVVTSNTEVSNQMKSYGDCWSLSHWQRLALLLGRSESFRPAYNKTLITNLIRGTESYSAGINIAGFSLSQTMQRPLTDYRVFGWPAPRAIVATQLALFASPNQGVETYYSDIHSYQKNRFYRGSNLRYVLARNTANDNFATLKRVYALANAHRLPMLLMREKINFQHVVLVTKAVSLDPNNWVFTLLDPNNPLVENTLRVERIGRSLKVTYRYHFDTDSAGVDVFLIGEEERPLIDEALLKHYRAACAS